jgi:hypothetical protein
MARTTTTQFLHISKEGGDTKRLKQLARKTGIPFARFEYRRKEVIRVLDFARDLDTKYHDYVDEDDSEVFLGLTLHTHIASDLRSLIILAIEEQNFQANIILRHLIDSFVFTLWADLTCRFRGTFNYFIDSKEWKDFRSEQRVTWKFHSNLPNRSIEERLERIRLLNFIKASGRKYYKRYFESASSCDLLNLLSLPICGECMKKRKGRVNFQEFHLDMALRKTGKEDMHAIYRSDFGFTCSFCGRQRISSGFAHGIPDSQDMLDMLAAILNDDLILNVRWLQKAYAYLSDEFVHFSTTVHPDSKPKVHDFEGKKAVLWGLNGIIFILEIMRPLMTYYFRRLRIAKTRPKIKLRGTKRAFKQKSQTQTLKN